MQLLSGKSSVFVNRTFINDKDPAFLFSIGELTSDHLISSPNLETPPKTNSDSEKKGFKFMILVLHKLTEKELEKHGIKRKVTNPKHICTFCQQEFKFESLLKRHVIGIHLKKIISNVICVIIHLYLNIHSNDIWTTAIQVYNNIPSCLK